MRRWALRWWGATDQFCAPTTTSPGCLVIPSRNSGPGHSGTSTHPDDLATNLSVFNKTLNGEAESYCIEKRYARKDGGIVWASLTVGSVRTTDGGVDCFVSVVQDITDRKRAEARLADRNAQLDLAGKIARIGSFMYDHGTKKAQLSPGCAAIYGLPEGVLEISREDGARGCIRSISRGWTPLFAAR